MMIYSDSDSTRSRIWLEKMQVRSDLSYAYKVATGTKIA